MNLSVRLNKKRKYTIPVHWAMANDMEIEAESLDQAIQMAHNSDHIPVEGAMYIDDSFTINVECATVLNQEDEE